MQFNSIVFFFFYLVTFVVYYIVPTAYRWIVLLAASVYFFLSFEPGYIFIISSVILLGYFAGRFLEKSPENQRRKIIYLVVLISQVLMLVFFKYFNFLNESLTAVLGIINVKNTVPYMHWIIPVGISYFTFQSVGYLIDIKNGKYDAEKNLGHYALFILYFPHLSSGPIARGDRFLPQLKSPITFKKENLYAGSAQILYGLFKKAVVGDMLGDYVHIFYENYTAFSGFSTLFSCWIFLFQVYADFSGYSDMAVGFSRVLGIEITNNFELPLFSKTMTEVWRRWHISLSTWLRDYLFTPLVISKRDWGKWAVVFAQITTFAICGIWHGAGWLFLIYGLMHGIFLSLEFLFKIKSSYYNKTFLRKCLGVFITINLYSFSLVFFRSSNWQQAGGIFKKIFTSFLPIQFNFYDTAIAATMLAMLGILIGTDYFLLRKNTWNSLLQKKPKLLFAVCVALFILILLFGISSSTQFIYFQF